jgi:hypothetical protein
MLAIEIPDLHHCVLLTLSRLILSYSANKNHHLNGETGFVYFFYPVKVIGHVLLTD